MPLGPYNTASQVYVTDLWGFIIMSKLFSLALTIAILATIAIAEPKQSETTEAQQEPKSAPAAETQQGKTVDDKESAKQQLSTEDKIKQADISLAIERLRAELHEKIDDEIKQPPTSLAKEQLRTELHENRADDLKWALGIMVTLFVVFIGYISVKRGKEYKELLKEARDASRDAVGYADKMRDKLDSLNETFDKKIKEIDDMAKKELGTIRIEAAKELDKIREQGTEEKKEVAKEAEKERKIAELWSESLRAYESKGPSEAAAKFKMIIEIKPDCHEAYSNWGASLTEISTLKGGDEELLEKAISKCEKAIELKPNYHNAYTNWGVALAKMSDLKAGDQELLGKAIDKYKKAIEINPVHHNTYSNWGVSLLKMSTLKGGDEGLLKEAEEKLLRAEEIKRGSAAYNLACVSCRLADEEGCKKWLKLAEKEGTLQIKDYAMNDDDLANVRDEEWFKELKWRTNK